jgi:hypothetical protein
MDPQVKITDAVQRRPQRGDDLPQPDRPGQQWLPAVQDDLHGWQRVSGRVISDAPRRLRGHLWRDDQRPPAPALVGGLIHIAVITHQITTAVNLQNNLSC